MTGFAILAAFHLIGVFIQHAVGLPIPGNVIGLVLFTIALFTKAVKLEWVEESAQFLLKHMLLFFAPIVVGVMAVIPIIRSEWLPAVASLVGSTLISLWLTGWLTQRLMKREGDDAA